jgi:Holliday junction resolvase RusA-like endonuclease
MKVDAWMYQDYDNILKPITDALKLAKIIKDDRYVLNVSILKEPIKRGQLGKLDVWVGTIE